MNGDLLLRQFYIAMINFSKAPKRLRAIIRIVIILGSSIRSRAGHRFHTYLRVFWDTTKGGSERPAGLPFCIPLDARPGAFISFSAKQQNKGGGTAKASFLPHGAEKGHRYDY